MQLKSLEIQGFKSFPDKTRLEFGRGITGVVGPNGSGKSNIVDAVRWVFGEQSSKTLRGSKMEDVIFLGAQTRKAQGMAAVTLTIDNRDRTMPMDCDEISIARRLYRSGESEYRLNGAAVRLKDVHELFMDTGLGRDGYSIIGQGKIEEIVSGKGRERRDIFDEAAGISKYRYRKGEAQRQLAQAEENLLRLKDILVGLEDRVEPLRRDSEKAAAFLQLSGEKKQLEISVWMADLDRCRSLLRELEDKYLLVDSQRQEMQAEKDTLEETAGSLAGQMTQATIAIEGLREEIRRYEQQQAQNQADVAVGRNDLLHCQETLARLEQEQANFAGGRESLDLQLAQLEESRTVQAQALEQADASTARMEQEIAAAQEQAGESAREGERHRIRRGELYRQIDAARQDGTSAMTRIELTAGQLELLRSGAAGKEEDIRRVQEELADCEELLTQVEEKILGCLNAKAGYELKRQSRQSRWEALKQQQNTLLDKAREHRQRAGVLQDMDRNMEGFAGSVKYLLRQARDGALRGVCGPVSQLITTAPAHTLAIETALGGAMQNIVVENEQAAKAAIRSLADSRQGRATFLPLTAVQGNELAQGDLSRWEGYVGIASQLVTFDSRYAGVVRQLLGRVVISQDLDSAVAMAKGTGYRFRIVTLDGQVVNAGGSMTGGSSVKTGGVLGRRQEIDRLEGEANRLEEESQGLSHQLDEVRRELGQIDAQMQGIEGENRAASEDRIRALGERDRLTRSLEEMRRAAANVDKEEARLRTELEELDRKNLSSSRLLDELTAALAAEEEAIAQQDEKRIQWERRAEALRQELGQARLVRLGAAKDLESAEERRRQLQLQRENQQLRHRQLEEEITARLAEKQQLEERIVALGESSGQLGEEIAACRLRIEEEASRHTRLEGEATRLRRETQEILVRMGGVQQELARLEERRLVRQKEYDGIIARLWDEYEMSRSQAEEIALRLEDMAAAQRRLQELRGKIKALGNVNLGAIEEYREVYQQYSFLKSQLEDVERSKAELTRLIGELTGQMKEIFLENFHRISRNFSRIFTELFGGGKAGLSLTDEEDVLECGIDILVQPPGKVVSNLTALSGGERAFVAIAIYFAILSVNPAPFCLLDEIEAALDDVNVAKFAQYLHRLTDHTQFIAITHRRGTMEEADVLYGVTMQEDGVSKLLELKISEVEQKLGLK